jgi:hypothetical protein
MRLRRCRRYPVIPMSQILLSRRDCQGSLAGSYRLSTAVRARINQLHQDRSAASPCPMPIEPGPRLRRFHPEPILGSSTSSLVPPSPGPAKLKGELDGLGRLLEPGVLGWPARAGRSRRTRAWPTNHGPAIPCRTLMKSPRRSRIVVTAKASAMHTSSSVMSRSHSFTFGFVISSSVT